MMDSPNLILLAGPNGAGKTTASRDLLAGTLRVHHFVNADEIANELAGDNPEPVAINAGRIMLDRLHSLTAQRANVAFESTLATPARAAQKAPGWPHRPGGGYPAALLQGAEQFL